MSGWLQGTGVHGEAQDLGEENSKRGAISGKANYRPGGTPLRVEKGLEAEARRCGPGTSVSRAALWQRQGGKLLPTRKGGCAEKETPERG